MEPGTTSHAGRDAEQEPVERPAVSVHESTPERFVFIEAANADGWIASDTTKEVTR